jgi:prepilin-type N-terminal cleavage/methylation domain-containing protein
MKKKGFTLVELMVTITIMMIMTSVVLFNYSRFNETSLLSQFAYDLSLSIRQAQVYGIASRESGINNSQSGKIDVSTVDSVSNKFQQAYGVHFDMRNPEGFILFLDADNDGVFVDGTDVELQSYSFKQRGIKIGSLSVVGSDGEREVNTLDITFIRPDPEARITGDGDIDTDELPSRTIIKLESSDGRLSKSVVVELSGQISVQ